MKWKQTTFKYMSKAKKLIQAAKENGGNITTSQAVELLQHHYYHNARKYVGEILSRLVKSGKLKRVKPGAYELNAPTIKHPGTAQIEQPTLFQ